MAEIIGAVAGILTLSRVVLEGANIIYELYKAPIEIRNLQVV